MPDERLADFVKRAVDGSPPLTPTQFGLIAVLLRPALEQVTGHAEQSSAETREMLGPRHA